jgi:hypothetical protein
MPNPLKIYETLVGSRLPAQVAQLKGKVQPAEALYNQLLEEPGMLTFMTGGLVR